MTDLETPCIKICVLDPASKHCLGCGRSLAEIERWTVFSDEERRRIMAELPRRIAARSAQSCERS
jgi:predicted Fe-S protein YdhL (DUF1289 family)